MRSVLAEAGGVDSGPVPGVQQDLRHWVCAVFVLVALACGARPAQADDRLFEVGGGVGMAAQGTYDVGEGLGLTPERSDLGPATLGTFFTAGFLPTRSLVTQLEAGLAFGGLVKTDERYWGERSNVGSTLTVWARANAAWQVLQAGWLRLRLGAGLGAARMAEATGFGSVRVDSLLVGPLAELCLGDGLRLQLHGDVNVPLRANISDRVSGDPSGTFYSGGAKLMYLWGIGHR